MALLDLASFEDKITPILTDAILRFPYEAAAEIKINMTLSSLASAKTKNSNTGVGSLRVITGNLARSFEKFNQGNIFQITKLQSKVLLVYGSELPYAKIHEFGGKANHAILPKRPYFYIGLNNWKLKFQRKLELKLKIAITDELQLWLEKQKQSQE